MSKGSSTASSAGGMTEKQVKRETEAILRDLNDIERRWSARRTAQEEAELIESICRVRLRVIAFARSRGGATFARMMRPHDDPVSGDNVVRFRRRVR